MPLDPGVVAKVLERFKDDVQAVFAEGLSPASDDPITIGLVKAEPTGNEPTEQQAVAVSDAVVAVPWTYDCTHTGIFLGIPPTFIRLQLSGTTFIDPREQNVHNWTYYRYVDFIGALHQLGVQTSVRPALTSEQYLNWYKQTHAS
jgi:SnoaL-like polyketide cyclase